MSMWSRSASQTTADKRRDPAPFLAFAGPHPGMKVLDMGAGGGYSTELLARAVTPGGIVYAQNPPDLPEKPKATFEARLKTPAMKDVVPEIRSFDDPAPSGGARSSPYYVSLFLPRHDVHERRSCRDGS